MAVLSYDKREIHIGDDGVIVMAEPTNERWNRYLASLSKSRGNQMVDNETNADAELFDDLVLEIQNITVRKGGTDIEVDLKNYRNEIPTREKVRLLRTFLAAAPKMGVDETKNSCGTSVSS